VHIVSMDLYVLGAIAQGYQAFYCRYRYDLQIIL